MLTLYLTPGTSSMAPHIALHEIGRPFEVWPVSLSKKENRSEAYLALNAEGKVPTLLVDGMPLTEVAAILFYLAKRYPEVGLLPPGELAEAQAISWMSFIAATLHPARRQGLDHARAIYGIAEARLGKGPWALETYSIADIHLFRLYWRFRNAFQLQASDFPNLSAHYERMMARPAVQRTFAAEAAIGPGPHA
jgi:glutathione S-transferase